MADIKAFKGLRFSEKKFSLPPVAPPYDIISEEQREALAGRDYNIINIDKPGRKDDESRYERAKELFSKWRDEGVLVTEDEEALYVYQEEYSIPERDAFDRYIRTGFFTALKLEEFANKVVLPHEKTLSAPKIDRLKLMKATKANISPIFGLYHDEKGEVKDVLAVVTQEQPVFPVCTDDDGTNHTLWKLTDKDLIGKITDALKGEKVIIADGHHRYETALSYRDYITNELGEINENANYILMCLVDFSDPGLVVLPTHRQVTCDIPTKELLSKLEDYFEVAVVSQEALSKMASEIDTDKVVIGLYTQDNDRSYMLTLKDDSNYEKLMPKEASPLWKRLNVSVLSFCVFKDVLGLSEEEFQKVVTYTHSTKEAFDSVDNNKVDFVFLLQGIDKFAIKNISEQAELMPQKSTYFYPKLFTGFVMYSH